MSRLTILFIMVFSSSTIIAQTKLPDHENKIITMGIVPGISTSGLQPRRVIDQISLNLFSGYSAATEGFAFSLIQNLNTSFSRGLFIAGLSNVTGVNNPDNDTPGEEKTFEMNLHGLQASGFLNLVLENTFGSQLSGAFNITKGGFFGFQCAGIGNVVHKYTFGAQLSSIFNISNYSISGAQLSALYNQTKGRLEGLQLSGINMAGTMHGKNSQVTGSVTGVQVGLFNKAGQMDGFQIGLINIGKKMQGTQIGLINIAGRGTTPLTRDGTAIGLLNFGNALYSQIYLDDQLFLNYELGTGIFKNGRMQQKRNRYIYGTVTYSKSPALQLRKHWMAGLGLFKLWAPRSISMGEYYVSSAGFHFLHYNNGKEYNNGINPLLRLRYLYGRRINKKLGSIYAFAAVTGNLLFASPEVKKASDLQVTVNNNQAVSWPGFLIGIMTK